MNNLHGFLQNFKSDIWILNSLVWRRQDRGGATKQVIAELTISSKAAGRDSRNWKRRQELEEMEELEEMARTLPCETWKSLVV